MKERLPKFIIWLLAIIGFTLIACNRPENPLDKDLQVFAEAFRKANKAEDTGPMLDLYHLDGVEKRTVLMLEQALGYELGLPVGSIDFEPLSGAPEESIDFTHDGVRYGPSLEPTLRMRVVYAVEDKFTSLFTLGRTKDGNWRIVSAKPRQEPDLGAAIVPR